MVYVNSKKFACESCIKGHRSSSCHHSDRPLFEVKKKGRPVSQCQKCRELRQSKRVHSKCTCNEADDTEARKEVAKVPLGSKSKRFIPIIPALPNGLQDVLKSSRVSSSLPADVRQRVDTLLNPCPCKSLWKCKCRSSGHSHPKSQQEQGGLKTLACAASIIEHAASTSSSSVPRKTMKRISSRPSSPNNTNMSHKRTKSVQNMQHVPGPDLPPIFLDSTSDGPGAPLAIPDFGFMPPMSTITSLAGSGCSCGVRCACPGCIEHRGPEMASKTHKNCADGCGSCIDYTSGVELPTLTQSSSSTMTHILDRFFARAAALPPPPTNRKIGAGVGLDPMNTDVYPDVARSDTDRALAFGLVTIPKLECCGGRCACPAGTCGCGKSCDGCCRDHLTGAEEDNQDVAPVNVPPSISIEPSPAPAAVRSCCAARAAAG